MNLLEIMFLILNELICNLLSTTIYPKHNLFLNSLYFILFIFVFVNCLFS